MTSHENLNPDNYTWQKIGNRIVCRDKHTGKMLFNCHKPVTTRHALLLGFYIGWELSEDMNANYINWLEGIFDQFKPETLPMSDGEYLELLSQIEGEPLMDMGMQETLDAMDAESLKEWEAEKARRQKEVEDSWANIEEEAKKDPDYFKR